LFESYTEKARRVIFFARYEASQFGTPSIEPEHVLLGILREDKLLLSRDFLVRARLSVESIRDEIQRRTLLQEKISTSVELPLAAVTKRVLAYAGEESDRLNHRHIGPEHLLLGILREEASMAAEILVERGVRLELVREALSTREMEATELVQQLGPAPGVLAWLEELKSHGERVVKLAERVGEGLSVIRPVQAKSAHRRRQTLGVEKLLETHISLLRGARVGLICNQASIDHDLRHVADLFHEHSAISLTALFGPQHGIRGEVQDNMVETGHSLDNHTRLPVYSLYSETREPTSQMLENVDVLVFDMQDVGCRIYTFIYTLANCMRAARKYQKKVIVCDRPNPINGEKVEGTVLKNEYASFVGQFPIATRHGMTVGEIAQMFNEHFGIGCDLEVVRMEGWSRDQWFDLTDAPWVMPSPNMPTLQTATVFPGAVHVEGTMMSEGRGTTRPFELIGAPYINPTEYAQELSSLMFDGVYFRPCSFQPTFQKHAGQPCGGVQIHVIDRNIFDAVGVGVATIKVAFDLYKDQFHWKDPPYEYVFDKNPFDVIAGTSELRLAIERGDSVPDIVESWIPELEEFASVRAKYLIY
jgi:uncharacterized protein YbbC (DUF1343 family)